MSLKPLRIISVGRFNSSFWKEAAEHYKKRLGFYFKIREDILKDAPGSMPLPERIASEGRGILAARAPEDILICLDEKGENFKSSHFAALLEELNENKARRPCFIIGGSYGLDQTVREASHKVLSLGKMTLTHEMAKVILLEQIYRAETIMRNMPYHH